jgi:hypothetical protein
MHLQPKAVVLGLCLHRAKASDDCRGAGQALGERRPHWNAETRPDTRQRAFSTAERHRNYDVEQIRHLRDLALERVVSRSARNVEQRVVRALIARAVCQEIRHVLGHARPGRRLFKSFQAIGELRESHAKRAGSE